MNHITHYPFPSLSKNKINVMSYNVGFCSGHLGLNGITYPKSFIQDNLNRICKTVTSNNVDVLCVQEIDIASRRSYYINQIEHIAKNCEFPYVYSSQTWKKRWVPYPTTLNFKKHFGKTEAAQVIFSKFPIINATTEVFRKPQSNSWIYNLFYINRLTQSCVLQLNKDQCLQVINCHFDAYDGAERDIQTKQTLAMIQHERVIVCGDFNSGKGLNNIDCSEKRSLTDVFQNQQTVTFPSNHPTRRLDYILISHTLSSENAKVLTTDDISSDHCPIMSTLSS